MAEPPKPVRNLGFEISTLNRKIPMGIDEMLKDIVEKQCLYEGLSNKAKELCRDRFIRTMAVNFVLLSNKAETDHTFDSTRTVLEKFIQSCKDTASNEVEVEPRESINIYEALRHSIYGEVTCDGESSEWSKLRESGLLTVVVVCDLHRALMEGLCNDGGKIRKKEGPRLGDVQTEYGGKVHHYPPPEILEDGFYGIIDSHNIHMEGIEKDEISLEKTLHIFKCATWLLFKLVSLHPFFNGNGRLCRILANYVLSLIIPFPVPIYIAKSAERNRKHYLDAIVHDRDNPEEGMGELASMLVEAAFDGWRDLFQYLEAGGMVGSRQLIGPIVVQKSRRNEIKEKVERLKGILDIEEVISAVQGVVDSTDTSSLTLSDQHIFKKIEVKCDDNTKLLQIEIYS